MELRFLSRGDSCEGIDAGVEKLRNGRFAGGISFA